MNTFATKTVSVQTTAKPKMLSYIYLYRMHKFNRMKSQLKTLPERISLAEEKYKKSWIPAGDMHYDGPRAQYYGSKKDRLKKRQALFQDELPLLAAKLANEEKLSSFVQKQVETEKLGFFQKQLRAMKKHAIGAGAMAATFVVAVVALAEAASIFSLPFENIGKPTEAAVAIGIIALSFGLSYIACFRFENAWKMLELGRAKAEKLASEVKKLAA